MVVTDSGGAGDVPQELRAQLAALEQARPPNRRSGHSGDSLPPCLNPSPSTQLVQLTSSGRVFTQAASLRVPLVSTREV